MPATKAAWPASKGRSTFGRSPSVSLPLHRLRVSTSIAAGVERIHRHAQHNHWSPARFTGAFGSVRLANAILKLRFAAARRMKLPGLFFSILGFMSIAGDRIKREQFAPKSEALLFRWKA